jgi:fatty acid elongase 3
MSVASFPTYDPIVLGPMSLSPWTNFDRLWASVMGYPADEFEFHSGVTALSTFKETAAVIALYLVVVFGGREFMRNRKPLQLNGPFMAHNLILTVVSAALLALFAEQLLPTLWKYGLYENICGGSGWTRPLVALYYVRRHIPGRKANTDILQMNYLVKYVELIDTVFLVVKKKPLSKSRAYV